MRESYQDPYDLSITRFDDDRFEAAPTTIHRARKYVAKMDAAVAGEEGHAATFKVACALVRVFDLSFGDLLKILIEFNHRCQPPWSFEELKHKATEAAKLADSAGNRSMHQSTRIAAKPYISGFREFSPAAISQLSRLRNIPECGIQLAAERGFLRFGIWHGLACYAMSDCSGKLIELRQMNGKLFPAVRKFNLGERKSHTLRGSQKDWSIGIFASLPFEAIALVEGGPDFLYAHFKIVEEGARERVAVVAMMSSSPYIALSALKYFRGKRVRIFPHLDAAGLNAGKKWQKQLRSAGATQVDIFDLSGLVAENGDPIGDLCDLTKLSPEALPQLGRMMP